MTSEAQRMSGAFDKSLISRCVTLLAFSLVLMASADDELSTLAVQIPVAELKTSLSNQVTLSLEILAVLNFVICFGGFHLGCYIGKQR